MAQLSALNNSSIDDEMSLEEILKAADERAMFLDGERTMPSSQVTELNDTQWMTMLETAKKVLPEVIQPFVTSARDTHREDQPNEVAVAIDLPDAARIFFGPWVWSGEKQEYTVSGPWRNKPFQVAGGNMEEFGDLLDAIARAREIHRQRRSPGG